MRLHRILCDEAVTGAAVPVDFLSTVRQPLLFFVMQEISLRGISGITTKAACEEMRLKRRARKGVCDFFCRLLLLAKKRFTRVNKDNDKHKKRHA